MKYHIGDKFIIAGIEARVAFVDSYGQAYLVPEEDGEEYNNYPTRQGLVFTVINSKGRDKLGNRASSVSNQECGAV